MCVIYYNTAHVISALYSSLFSTFLLSPFYWHSVILHICFDTVYPGGNYHDHAVAAVRGSHTSGPPYRGRNIQTPGGYPPAQCVLCIVCASACAQHKLCCRLSKPLRLFIHLVYSGKALQREGGVYYVYTPGLAGYHA